MMVRCPMCENPLTSPQRRMVTERSAERKKRLALKIDTLLQRHRTALEKSEKDAEKEWGKGYEEGVKEARKHYGTMVDLGKLFKELAHSEPPALLARPEAMLRGLRIKFPKDHFQHTPHGNSIIQTIRFNGADAGVIVYLCKPDAGKVEELDTRAMKTLMARRGAMAGIQVVRNVECNSCDPGIFIICQKMALSLASVIREGIVLMAEKQEDFLRKQEVLGECTYAKAERSR